MQVPIEDLRPISLLEPSLAKTPPAEARQVNGLSINDCYLSDPGQLDFAEIIESIKSSLWIETVLDEGQPTNKEEVHSPLDHRRMSTVQLISLNGVSFADFLTPHLRMECDTTWLESCSCRKLPLNVR